ncbi:MAG: apolipoprotein N-acyltransferase [Spirochaetales bacterium]|uniref:Apolipoprotein N-acyltransferase n=1 Tax=Candidatus Thalassospirochaeta sargassi TaxID=3119039 RepID=A0AAJ1MIX1_9SPIO|nr:apolipoprotein N-acyltransferase [Spirochaetales bacterium]
MSSTTAVQSPVGGAKRIFTEIGLLALSAVLFALSFPNVLNVWGLFPLAFICLVPLFIVVHTAGWGRIFVYGIAFGYACYALFNYWLSTFHPLAIVIVPVIYAAYFLVLVPLMKLADSLFPRWGFLLQSGLWMGYEYLRTLGFLGYPYGNLGYSQYLFRPFIQISSVFGFWFVSLMVVLPSAFLGNALKNGLSGFKPYIKKNKLFIYIYAAVFIAVLIFGFTTPSNFDDSPQIKLGFVQHNADSWKGGTRQFESNKNKLIELSGKALEEDPGIEMMIWSETCFVPGIDWHTRYRNDPVRYRMVKDLTDFFATQDIPYVIGNDDGQLEPNEDGELVRVDYNAVLLYDKELKQTYRKTHLVPFSENFPYEKQLPWLYEEFKKREFHWWKKGTEYTVFEAAGIKFSTPICFEDVFGYLSRIYVNNGAQIIVNLTNDSWSGSVPAEMQHMAMGVFRAVENRRTMVRGTNAGITCTIEPDGEITAMIAPFEENYMINTVPVYEETTTLYTRWGDWFAVLNLVVTLTVLAAGIVVSLVRIINRRRAK